MDSVMIISNIIDNVETKFPNYADYQKIRSDFIGFQKLHASNKFSKNDQNFYTVSFFLSILNIS